MPVDSFDAVIAVFETYPYWGPELQRQFPCEGVTIRECRSVGDLFPSIEGFESTLLVIDLEAALVECLAWLGTDVTRHPVRVPMIALGSVATAEFEWLLREAGVTAFLPDRIAGDDFARLCRRQLGRRPLGLPRPRTPAH